MKEFFKDYKDMVVKPGFKFMRKHWKGYLLGVGVSYGVGWLIGKHIENKIDNSLEMDEIEFKNEDFE